VNGLEFHNQKAREIVKAVIIAIKRDTDLRGLMQTFTVAIKNSCGLT
jgi:hypothetical protein